MIENICGNLEKLKASSVQGFISISKETSGNEIQKQEIELWLECLSIGDVGENPWKLKTNFDQWLSKEGAGEKTQGTESKQQ